MLYWCMNYILRIYIVLKTQTGLNTKNLLTYKPASEVLMAAGVVVEMSDVEAKQAIKEFLVSRHEARNVPLHANASHGMVGLLA